MAHGKAGKKATALLLGVVPLQYEAYGRVSLFTGTLNFLAYTASGLASVFTGLLVELAGWNGVLLSWAILAAVGSAALLYHGSLKERDRLKKKGSTSLPFETIA